MKEHQIQHIPVVIRQLGKGRLNIAAAVKTIRIWRAAVNQIGMVLQALIRLIFPQLLPAQIARNADNPAYRS